MLLGLVRAVAALRKPGRGRRLAAVLLIWLATPVLLMSVSAFPVHPHYLLLACPAGHLLAGWGLVPPGRRAWPRYALAPLLAAVAAVSAFNLQQANAVIAAKPVSSAFLEEWALGASSQVGRTIRQLAGDGRPLRVACDTHEAILSSLSATLVSTLQGLDYPDYVVLPSQELLLYVLPGKVQDSSILGPRAETFPERTLQFGSDKQVSFVRVLPYDREAALALPQVVVDRTSEAGLSLLGYSIEGRAQPGESFTCTTYWRVDELLPGRAEWYIGTVYHLVNEAGHLVANVGKHAQWGYRWRLGDVYARGSIGWRSGCSMRCRCALSRCTCPTSGGRWWCRSWWARGRNLDQFGRLRFNRLSVCCNRALLNTLMGRSCHGQAYAALRGAQRRVGAVRDILLR